MDNEYFSQTGTTISFAIATTPHFHQQGNVYS